MFIDFLDIDNKVELNLNEKNLTSEDKIKLKQFFDDVDINHWYEMAIVLKTKLMNLNNDLDGIKKLKKDIDLSDISGEEKKILKQNIDELNKKSLSYNLCQDVTDSYEYLIYTNSIFKQMFEFENKRAFSFLQNKEEAEKAGWYSKNPTPKTLIEWAEKAYPYYNVPLLDTKIDLFLLQSYLTIVKQQ